MPKSKHLHVAVIAGGGGGSSVVSMIKYLPKGTRLDMLVTTTDDGGGTGKLRIVEGIPAVGDIRRIQAAASQDPEASRLWNIRFGEDSNLETVEALGEQMLSLLAKHSLDTARAWDILHTALRDIASHQLELKGQAFGNLVLAALIKHHDFNMQVAVAEADVWLQTGNIHVIPTIVEPSNLLLFVDNEPIKWGQHNIDKYSFNVGELEGRDVYVEPRLSEHGPLASLSEQARESVTNADIVVLAPGSWLTSISPSLAARGMTDALREMTMRGGSIIGFANLVQESTLPGFSAEHYQALAQKATADLLHKYYYHKDPKKLPISEGVVPLRHGGNVGNSNNVMHGEDLVAGRIAVFDQHDELAAQRSKLTHDAETIAKKVLKDSLRVAL